MAGETDKRDGGGPEEERQRFQYFRAGGAYGRKIFVPVDVEAGAEAGEGETRIDVV